ncbi:protein of unknown function; putative exported protein [Methylorubrum extorquens DM4]|uniref:Uncharacterized protein n=1 Tax=Methylorubrum extorquens (strain DSM 6343 / CIP 106787 / DM4) TaxID=661410 RepID=C7CCA6_METED|nr:protein of unknown function; putative exported protein [Methylorubrum extorquens DM4]
MPQSRAFSASDASCWSSNAATSAPEIIEGLPTRTEYTGSAVIAEPCGGKLPCRARDPQLNLLMPILTTPTADR